ncbi:MBL fold metallo-hydrolase [Candidatus Dependentiae bacterium]|nr:MBL fold metallo-hydrolase [Candidatus Dependentiae bacterium]
MKRLYPERSYGRFLCLDGLSHEWVMPIIKTFVHSVKAIFWDKELKLDLNKISIKPTFKERSYEPEITWIGHSTFLIQVAGKNILTDPIFSTLSVIFRRLVTPSIKIEELPPIDYVIISHNHFDHMDSASLMAIKERFSNVKILVPMGDKDWFDCRMFTHVSEHMWWDEFIDEHNASLKFTFLPANHWSQRTLFDKNKSLWGSWMIQDKDFTLYFAGDTSWGNHFKMIGKEFKDIDVALLPIAPGEPRSWMKDTHINAEEAVRACLDLNARTLIPMHWGTYHLGFDEYFAPIELLKKSWKTMQLKAADKLVSKNLRILKFGELASDLTQKIIISVAQKSGQITL